MSTFVLGVAAGAIGGILAMALAAIGRAPTVICRHTHDQPAPAPSPAVEIRAASYMATSSTGQQETPTWT